MKDIVISRARTLVRHASMCLLLTSGLSAAFGQTTYYVANSGNDGNTGRSADSPFQTIAKVNTLQLEPGDQVLFRRNNTFRGTLRIRRSGTSGQPIVVDAYGDGNKPVLSGATPVTDWTNLGNNIWEASCPSCGDAVTGVYRDNTALPLGRYPNLDASNRGYLTVQSHSGKTQLTSQQGFPANWVGGEVVYRPVQWILNCARITGQNGNTLNLVSAGTYDITDRWGFFIQNHPATLDQNGEWYYNPSNKSIRLFDNQNNPNDQSIAATAHAEVVDLTTVSFVTVRNLHITQAINTNLLVTNGSNLVFADNDITQAGEDGILVRGNGNAVLIENNLIEDINNNGVNIAAYQAITFRNNTVRRIALFPGRGRSGDGTYVGFMSSSTGNTMIENNVFDNIGYNALNFASSTTLQRNRISNFCLTKSDGSGLYIWNGNQQPMSGIRILSNVVYNGIGAPEGSPAGAYSGANGIYLDDCTTNIEVANNSVYNCVGLGFYLHGSSNITMTGNTAFNNGEGQLAVTTAGGCQPRNNLIENNIFVSKLPNQFNVKFESAQNDLGSYGQMNNNVYSRPFEDTYTIRAVYNNTVGADLSLETWRSRYGKDQNTLKSPITYSNGNPDDVLKFIGNPSGSPIQVSLSGTYRDARNNPYADQVTVAAFSSIVLFKEIASIPVTLRDPENPANAVSGLDYAYYEGSWNSLPNFSALTPVRTGNGSQPDIAVRSREENYGLRYTGYISVPTDGVYSFYTNSDDGSKLFIGATEVVNNDGSHGEQERSGTIGLKAGRHAITIIYYQGGGGQALTVSYGGPGVGKQTLPASALWRVASDTPPPPPVTVTLRDPENPNNTVSGLDYSYYEGSWGALPNFGSLTPVKTGANALPELTVRSRPENYGLRYTGFVRVPADGVYTFYTNSDDGSKLFIGNTEVVNNDGGHAEQERSGTIGLKAGVHAITIIYFQGGGGQAMTVSYGGPGLNKQQIPASAYQRIGTVTPPPVSVNLRDPENPANAINGLTYGYYEGSWGTLPNFGSLIAQKTGVNNLPNLTVRSRDNNYGLRYVGYVSVPADGVYTFYTNSDDGSKLFIGNTEVVNNDGGHAEQERSGTIGLKAGVHAITIIYFQGGGGQAMTVSYGGPGLNKQQIPSSAYLHVGEVVTSDGTGLRAEYFNNATISGNPVMTRTDATVDFDWGNGSPSSGINTDYFSVRWTGKVKAPVTGNYTFSTSTDDGVRLWVNGKLIVDDWNGRATKTNNSPTVALIAGQRYDIRMEYFDNIVGAVARLSWAYQGQGQQIIPQAFLYPASGSARMAATLPVTNAESDFTPDMAVQVFPVPARDELQVRYYAQTAGELTLQLTSVGAYPVMQQRTTVTEGENMIRVPVREYNRGMYILSLIQGTQRVTKKVLLAD
ncbi:PA14 domain-containing protein [Fibrella aquatica]|uniref:PA14 domain-containing protein n=1 Tax=Fibrella aquatica TaxID=3242487 RepID=UPI003521A57E